ncbi:hypothetical protein GF339_23865, partial [candidate division KSB3 bacterium]|nr:hypothetical protein [candidate division KSB3 bacterium]MBD3327641.1 hypothetical protein [candidate division KSB3 bacterium]
MHASHDKLDIILINIDYWFPSSSALAVLDPYLKQHGINSRVISSSEIDQYIDQAEIFGISVMDHVYPI